MQSFIVSHPRRPPCADIVNVKKTCVRKMHRLRQFGLTSLLVLAVALVPDARLSGRQLDGGPDEAFDTASISRSRPVRRVAAGGVIFFGGRRVGTWAPVFKADRMTIRAMTLRQLVWFAYNRPLPYKADDEGALYPVIGGPKWVDSDEFDVDATMPAGTANDHYPAMLRTLLRDRFKLVTTFVTKDLPAKALVVHDSRRMGSRLRRSAGECPSVELLMVTSGKRAAPRACTLLVDRRSANMTTIHGRGVAMAFFARYLSSETSVSVVDQTGMTGAFDFDIETPTANPEVIEPEFVRPIHLELEAQLGLTLRDTRAPGKVLAIVSAEPAP
jgi:uncharacterized protein (TIGR03435 family)